MNGQDKGELEAAGFSEDQAEALLRLFTVHHHTHSIDEVIGLEDQLSELEDEADEDDADDEDD